MELNNHPKILSVRHDDPLSDDHNLTTIHSLINTVFDAKRLIGRRPSVRPIRGPARDDEQWQGTTAPVGGPIEEIGGRRAWVGSNEQWRGMTAPVGGSIKFQSKKLEVVEPRLASSEVQLKGSEVVGGGSEVIEPRLASSEDFGELLRPLRDLVEYFRCLAKCDDLKSRLALIP
ncbi:hypothetical protein Acr_26g0005620 [Actinidia rufa]|uniref:Uncharacterized protein n=1 Tax=Actinidia rufa TaxID=165716 RepID=A0A7J0H2N0_9ERIC|nr:hypothetical protein Acr_26g0005620 [Actinidia rufa]